MPSPHISDGVPLQLHNGTWTNGHIRFDDDGGGSYAVRLASSSRHAQPVAIIRWFGLWGEYVFYSRSGHIFAAECLRDIADFCAERTLERLTGSGHI